MDDVPRRRRRPPDKDRGERLRQRRLDENMSQQELAAASGVSINTIRNAENAHHSTGETTWRALETVLGIIPATPQNQA